MSDHRPGTITRYCDVAVVDSGAPGLGAALHLLRQRRSVIVVDPEGSLSPGKQIALEELRSHGGEVLMARAVRVIADGDRGVRVELVGGHVLVARHVVGSGDLADAEPATVRLDGARTAADGARIVSVLDTALDEAEAAGDDAGDPQRGARPTANQLDWDARYSGAPLWSGNPNGALVQEITGMTPGVALDVGAGEGGDAIWLAEHGWRVVASDVSKSGLDRVAAEASRRGVDVTCVRVDANSRDGFGTGVYDLVLAFYASVPRTLEGHCVRNLLDAVAVGGTLLVVSHDLEPMRAPIDTSVQSRPFDPDAYVRVEDVAAALAQGSGWEVVTFHKRPRPGGSASAAHHSHDIVLRARRVHA